MRGDGARVSWWQLRDRKQQPQSTAVRARHAPLASAPQTGRARRASCRAGCRTARGEQSLLLPCGARARLHRQQLSQQRPLHRALSVRLMSRRRRCRPRVPHQQPPTPTPTPRTRTAARRRRPPPRRARSLRCSSPAGSAPASGGAFAARGWDRSVRLRDGSVAVCLQAPVLGGAGAIAAPKRRKDRFARSSSHRDFLSV
jgi:hypothetical protein